MARPSSAAIGARRSAVRNRPYNEAVFTRNLMASSAGLLEMAKNIQGCPISAGTVNVNNVKKLQSRAAVLNAIKSEQQANQPKV